jgi:hypothetical protein
MLDAGGLKPVSTWIEQIISMVGSKLELFLEVGSFLIAAGELGS